MTESAIKTVNIIDLHQDSGNVEVLLFNVGQGDHILLKFPGPKYGIIDFYYDADINLPEPPALTYFKALKAELPESEFELVSIAFFCISHTDKDHIKGIRQTLDWFDVNGVFIEEFWFGAARAEAQLTEFLDDKLSAFIENLSDERQEEIVNQQKFFHSNLRAFFKSFQKWKDKDFGSARYKREETGKGVYLDDVKILRNPSPDVIAFNIGPLSGHLDNYYKHVTEDIVKKIICGDKKSEVDKNDMSHILCLKFGGKTLLFGGDTHKDIWEDCLDNYHAANPNYVRMLGPLKSHFVKVSHHGSKFSSSKKVWERILSTENKNLLGISSGRNKQYKHPNSETIADIRSTELDTELFPTNICHSCLHLLPYPKEAHDWYKSIKVAKRKAELPEVDELMDGHKLFLTESEPETDKLGLLAYIFEIPAAPEAPVNVRLALSALAKPFDCFYTTHEEKFCDSCEGSAVLMYTQE